MSSPIDWAIVRQIGHLVAGAGGPGPGAGGPGAGIGTQIEELAAASEPLVADYTGLELITPRPPAEAVSRPEWVDANVDSLRWLMDPVASRLGDQARVAGPLAPVLRTGAGLVLAAEIGVVTGYLSQRVLGQYDLGLPRAHGPQRLYFVEPNLLAAARSMQADRDEFLYWVALHEVTHVFEFQGVDWVRPHFLALIEDLLETVEVQVEDAAAVKATVGLFTDPRKLVELVREGDLVTHFASPRQRRALEHTQCLMAVLEGYSEHVMDAVGAEVIPSYAELRRRMDQRRGSRSAPERLLQRLIGLDLKLRQYELGKNFCDVVVERGGLARLNTVWQGPERLPNAAELKDPAAWLERTNPLKRVV